jgi:hypothetical protein
MTRYEGDKILALIVRLLDQSISNVGFPPYSYKVYLTMEPEEALKELSFRLRRIRDISKGSRTGFHYYFSTELEYETFLIESELAEYLNVYFVLKKNRKTIPHLSDDHETYRQDKEFSVKRMYKMTPFKNWLRSCQGKKTKTTRAVSN